MLQLGAALTVTTSGGNDYAPFRRALRRCATSIGRPLPWVGHRDPWAVLVSEVMLQQTQTSRVEEPWQRFLTAFPTPQACADAPLAAVLRAWAGLGYHRRARALHDAARVIRDQFNGVVPHNAAQLRLLPGVGEYTAHAVASFSFGERVAVLDTNVGRVLARALANRSLSRTEARALAYEVLPRDHVAEFNQAMLDLGAQFCRAKPQCVECPVAQSCRWHRDGGRDPAPTSAAVSRPQSRFQGSDRQLRGRALAALRDAPRTKRELHQLLESEDGMRNDSVIAGLLSDGLVERKGSRFRLAES